MSEYTAYQKINQIPQLKTCEIFQHKHKSKVSMCIIAALLFLSGLDLRVSEEVWDSDSCNGWDLQAGRKSHAVIHKTSSPHPKNWREKQQPRLRIPKFSIGMTESGNSPTTVPRLVSCQQVVINSYSLGDSPTKNQFSYRTCCHIVSPQSMAMMMMAMMMAGGTWKLSTEKREKGVGLWG